MTAEGDTTTTTMVNVTCHKCKTDVEDDEPSFECDGCIKWFHIKCDKVKKSDVNSRSGSERLRVYCADCCKSPSMANIENIKTILKVVFKMDAEMQRQSMLHSDVACHLDKIKSELASLKNEIGDVNKTIGANAMANNEQKKGTFASVVRAATKPAVIIKPKTVQQNSKATIDDIKSHVDYKHIDVCGHRNVRGGGIAVMCGSNASTMKMKNIISSKFGDKYEVNLPETLKPRVKIMNAMNDVPEQEIVNELRRQNDWLEDTDDIVLKKILEKKNRKHDDSMDIVLEVSVGCFDKLMAAGKVNLGWKKCNIVHHVHITRCFKCCGFAHIAGECKNKEACAKCGLEHKTKECTRENLECINCKSISQKYKLKLDCKHNAFSHKCPTLQKRIDRFARNFKLDEQNK